MKRGFEDDHAAAKAPRSYGSNNSLQDTIDSGATEIFRAMRLARGFERQKLGRRQKDARETNSQGDVERIDREIAVLKGFDLAAMAEYYFYKTLLRMPAISSAPQFPSSIATKVVESSRSVDASYLNVSARLFKSNAVASALEGSLRAIYDLIGIEPQLHRKKRLRKSDFQPTRSVSTDQRPSPGERASNAQTEKATLMSGPEVVTRQPSDAVVNQKDAKDPESTSTTSEGSSTDDTSEVRSKSSTEGELTDAEIDGVPAGKADKMRAALTTTAFLPSLAGGYISGSESDASDIEDLEDLKAKKNRPGQRARQARWELKYGSNAAHIKKQRQSRDHGWDARRGAQDESAKGKNRPTTRRNGPQSRGRAINSGGHSFQSVFNPRRSAKSMNGERQGPQMKQAPLHPSWEAAKQQKEQKNAAVFQGKKVVFD